MRIGCVMPIGIYEKALPASLSWDERLSMAAEAGYDFVEMSIDESEARLARLDWTESDIAKMRSAIAKAGIPIFTMGTRARTANIRLAAPTLSCAAKHSRSFARLLSWPQSWGSR